MSDQTPDPGVAKHDFTPSRRGYDRREVDRFAAEMEGRVESLERERDVLVAQLASLGVKRPKDLQAEFDAVSREVGRILQSAREAADALRSRAAEDATKWRREASAEAEELKTSAEHDAVSLRQDAWEASTKMLDQVVAEAERRKSQAAEDVLLIRAEAEQEAHRLVSQGRKDIEDEARLSRLESERMLSRARTEAENVIESARQEAEAAQERARALEERRAELMEELEEARGAIAELESELTARRESLRLPEAKPAVAASTSVKVVPAPAEEWVGDDESIRIVRKRPAAELAEEEVDALAMAAEVQRLREEPEPEPVAVEPEPAPVAVEPAPVAVEPAPVAVEPAPVAAEPEPEPVAVEVEPEPVPVAMEPEPVAVALEPEPESGTPVIDDLFERLRSGTSQTSNGSTTAVAERPVATVETTPAPTSVDSKPFDLRDRLLLPVTNRALREVKRVVVDLQNRVLEDIRTGGAGGEPDQKAFEKALRPALVALGGEAATAGSTAAAELLDATPDIDAEFAGVDMTSDFAGALVAAVHAAMDKSAAAGAGPRETSAAVSRVFRTWRTDEAERRLRHSAFGGYHAGLLASLGRLGVGSVRAVASGRPCGECPSIGMESWAPTGPPPAGTSLPPALLDCSCTIVPVG